MRLKEIVVGAAVAGGLAAGTLGLTAATAGATPPPPPAPGQPMPMVAPAPPAGPNPGSAPAWAPPKPVEPLWANGAQQVWDEGWNHWGVWMNGVFIPTY